MNTDNKKVADCVVVCGNWLKVHDSDRFGEAEEDAWIKYVNVRDILTTDEVEEFEILMWKDYKGECLLQS